MPLEAVEPRAYEVDSYLRCGIVHLINSATHTLQSLTQLLGKRERLSFVNKKNKMLINFSLYR